ncbi:MAG: GNAT family N-acetyltransferase [Pseudomonadota bacterium]
MEFREISFNSPAYALELQLREDILSKPLGRTRKDWEQTSHENTQLHFGLFDSEKLIACVVAAPISSTEIKIRQMAVSSEYQRKGIGLTLINEVEKNLKNRGFKHFTLHARTPVIDFYKKLGYTINGHEFIEATLPHLKMIKTA